MEGGLMLIDRGVIHKIDGCAEEGYLLKRVTNSGVEVTGSATWVGDEWLVEELHTGQQTVADEESVALDVLWSWRRGGSGCHVLCECSRCYAEMNIKRDKYG